MPAKFKAGDRVKWTVSKQGSLGMEFGTVIDVASDATGYVYRVEGWGFVNERQLIKDTSKKNPVKVVSGLPKGG